MIFTQWIRHTFNFIFLLLLKFLEASFSTVSIFILWALFFYFNLFWFIFLCIFIDILYIYISFMYFIYLYIIEYIFYADCFFICYFKFIFEHWVSVYLILSFLAILSSTCPTHNYVKIYGGLVLVWKIMLRIALKVVF